MTALLVSLLLATPQPYGAFADLVPEKLGKGPHTLVISDGTAMTRFEFKSGRACQKARDETRRQAMQPRQAGVIYGAARIEAICVPR